MGKAFTTLKYVRIGNEFRFADADIWVQHMDLLNVGEIAVSAGFFHFINGEVHLSDMPSTSLRLFPLPEDKELLQELLK